MTQESTSNQNTAPAAMSSQTAAEAAMLQHVLDEDRSAPWLVSDRADEYDSQIEDAGQVLEISDEEATQGWQGLSAQLSKIWAAEDVSVVALLQQKFAARMPMTVLNAIAQKAQQAVQSGQPMVDQMIGCVQDTFSQMAEADLQVMARPMAFAMRGSSADEFVDATVQSIPDVDWESLSSIEQARLSLAAARYAISQSDEQG